MPDAGVTVRVRHEVLTSGGANKIVYRCEVEGASEEVCAEVGQQVTSDFDDVIAALAAAAER